MRQIAFLFALLLLSCGAQPRAYEPVWAPVSDTPELTEAMSLDSPVDVMLYLNKVQYSALDCGQRWAPPQEVAASKTACCTGYARFWAEWARRHGQEAYIVGVWTRPVAHAFTVFRPPKGRWYLASNNDLWIGLNLPTDLKAASQAGAAFLMFNPPFLILAWDAEGRPVPL